MKTTLNLYWQQRFIRRKAELLSTTQPGWEHSPLHADPITYQDLGEASLIEYDRELEELIHGFSQHPRKIYRKDLEKLRATLRGEFGITSLS